MIEQINKKNIPKVSIGMPVYNGEKFIRDAVDSLLAQTFTDFELIISDNSSTDDTESICQEYANTDSRIKYNRQSSNIGPVANFEYVLNGATGQYFMWAACDDRWVENCLESMLNFLEGQHSYGLVFSNYKVKNLLTGKEVKNHVRSSDKNSKVYNYLIRLVSMCPSLIYGLYRTELIRNQRLEKFDFSDVHFVTEVALKTKIKILDEYLYVAGTNGERKPYSLSGNKIDRMPFLRKQYHLLKQHFSFPFNILMYGFVCLYMSYNKIRLWRY